MKNVLFQVHWFLGITAGLVLAVVGATGAMLSFEGDLLKALNPGVMTVPARADALAPAELAARIAVAAPGKTMQSLTLYADPQAAARVGFAPAPGAPAGPGGRPRGETRYVDPYTGALLGDVRGEAFFRTTMQIHRWLAADAVGKQIVGASTIALVYFCLSGLYLRWPRRWTDWRAWLHLDWRQKGRNFLWHLHAIVGTCVLVLYLAMALTGLQWSYEWYRNGLYALAGAPMPPARGPGGGPGGARPGEPARGPGGDATAPAADLAAAFAVFAAQVPRYSTVTLRLPQAAGQPLEFSYQDPQPAHARANNRLVLTPALALETHERYADKPAGQKLVASIFPLHSGEFFGLPGTIAYMLASLAMPLFAITGWMLYLDRRRKKRAVRAAAAALADVAAGPAPAASPASIVVAHASQSGTAERLAWQTAADLRAGGLAVRVVPLATLDAAALAAIPRLLVVASTFGEGQPPDAVRGFARRVMARPASLPDLHYGLLMLGDRTYADFCGFGHRLAHWLRQSAATPLFDPVEVDDSDAGALRHWQHHLGQLAGVAELPDWSAPRYQSWRLQARERINAGSPGGALYRLALQPPAGADWQAGDIAEIGPRQAPADVAAFLAASGHDGAAPVRWQEADTTLAAALAQARLPVPAAVAGDGAQALAQRLVPLPHREYSIASLPADGVLELLVRQMTAADGRLGLGSAWLTRDCAPGADVALRIRSNRRFHLPGDGRPLLLVGNGSGIAGLRALLRARIAAGRRRNWLVFGERSPAHDRPFGDELARAQADGFVDLDLVFSRAGEASRYVQDRLREQAPRLRDWVADGAAIYVCGSLAGMAPGVEAVLAEVLGADALEQLADAGRYRRDVY